MAEVVAKLPFSQAAVEQAWYWLRYFSEEWVAEAPMRIHTRDTDAGHGLGGMAFHHEFIVWLGPICLCPSCTAGERRRQQRNPAGRHEATRAFRKLRKKAPREFDALYCYVILKMTLEDIVVSFNRDAERLGREERYTLIGIVTLIVLGVEKVRSWWGT